MILLRCSFLCLISTLFILNCEAGRGFSSRGGGSRSSSSGGWGSSSRSKPSSSSGSSWFSSKPKPAPSPSYSRPAPSPSYGWNVQSPSPSISRPSSVSSPASLSYPRQPAYNPSYTVPKPSITAPKPNVYKPPVSVSKPVASAPPSSGSYPKQPGSTWTAQKPVGPPPAYPGLGGGSHANVNPPAYSRYTPRNQAPAYTPQRPNPPPYTPAVSQGVKPYSSVNSGSYPKQTYTAVPAGQATQYGYPRQQYGTTNQGYGSYGQSYGGGYGGHAAPAPVYNHYGGSVGYGYPSHGTGPTIINNHYGGGGGYGGGYGGFGGGYGGYGGGYGGGSSGSGIGSHLLTAGLFYGLGRVTSPSSYGYGYSGLGGSGYRSSSTTTNTHNTYNNYYDHGSTTTSTVLPPLQVVTDTNNQSPVLLAAQPQSTQIQGQTPTDIYLSQPKDPYGVIIPSNSTSSNENKQEPTVIIPRTVDLTKQKIFEPVEIPWDQVSKHKLVEYPLWLNESVVRLPAYGYNFPTWNETTVISAPLTAVKASVNAANAPVTTTPKPLEEPTGLGAKIGKLFYNVANWFSSGYKNDKSSEKTPQVYLDDETHGRPEAEMLKKVDEEKKPMSTVIDDALARARADVEKFNK